MQRTTHRRSPLAFVLVLVGATALLTGCGDQGAHLPAGMSGSSSYTAGGVDVVDSVLGTDPGPTATQGIGTNEDPILAGYDGIATIGDGSGDIWNSALNDWSSSEGSLSTVGLDNAGFDDDFGGGGYGGYGGGYGYGSGYGSDYGFGSGLSMAGLGTGGLGAAGYGGFNDFGAYGAGVVDDPALLDGGFSDPGFADAGFDGGFTDPGFADAGFDGGFVDTGGVDAGFSGGFDVGAASFDTGGGFDVGGGVVDVSGPSAVF